MRSSSENLTFTASEVAVLTGVGTNTQLTWRSRGFTPAGDGKWTRHTVRDVARIALLKAFDEAGLAVGQATKFLTDEFLGCMEAQLSSAIAGTECAEMLAVVVKGRVGFKFFLAFGLAELDGRFPDAQAFFVLGLRPIAAKVAARLSQIVGDEGMTKDQRATKRQQE